MHIWHHMAEYYCLWGKANTKQRKRRNKLRVVRRSVI